MKKNTIILLTIVIIGCVSCGQKDKKDSAAVEEKKISKVDSLKLIFVGDIMVHDAQIESALMEGENKNYNFRPVFQYVEDYLSSADLTLANLEVTFGGKPYRGYPSFSSPPQLADALKECGFDVLFLANNHILDRGKKGLEGTIKLLDEVGFYHTGIFLDAKARNDKYPLIVNVKKFKLVFLNYTYDTNGIVQSKPNIVNYIDTIQVKKDLLKAKNLNPDYIITYMHWGEEYESKESGQQRYLAKLLAENGTNIIIGSHPHVVQPTGNIITQSGETVPIIFSLGNFVSNQQERYKDGGIALEILLTKKENKTILSSIDHEPLWVNREERDNNFVYRIIPVSDYNKHKSKYNLTKKQQSRIKEFKADIKKIMSE